MKKVLMAAVLVTLAALIIAPAVMAGNPSSDGDCDDTVTDPDLGEGTRAELYNCKAIGNSGEEQGIYHLHGVAYDETHLDCDILVVWSGDFGGTPYLDYGTVFNRTKCSDGYVEVWGDRFGPDDPWAATPYVFTIGGSGDQVHHLE